jgi:hypothetical protein
VTEDEPKAPRLPRPLDAVPMALAVAAALLLLGGVLFAMASASQATGTGSATRFRLLGQAANPFIALLAALAAGLVADARRRTAPGAPERWFAPGAALGVATAVSLAVALLALNGVITDLTGDSGGLFILSAVVSRLATLVLAGVTLWLAAARDDR